jgi:hypothetical protein
MFRLVLFSVPVVILPLLVLQAVETMMTRSLLPKVATEMQRATQRGAEGQRAHGVEAQRIAAQMGVTLPLPLTLRF